MPIRFEDPELNNVLNFPDGTPETEINNVVQQMRQAANTQHRLGPAGAALRALAGPVTQSIQTMQPEHPLDQPSPQGMSPAVAGAMPAEQYQAAQTRHAQAQAQHRQLTAEERAQTRNLIQQEKDRSLQMQALEARIKNEQKQRKLQEQQLELRQQEIDQLGEHRTEQRALQERQIDLQEFQAMRPDASIMQGRDGSIVAVTQDPRTGQVSMETLQGPQWPVHAPMRGAAAGVQQQEPTMRLGQLSRDERAVLTTEMGAAHVGELIENMPLLPFHEQLEVARLAGQHIANNPGGSIDQAYGQMFRGQQPQAPAQTTPKPAEERRVRTEPEPAPTAVGRLVEEREQEDQAQAQRQEVRQMERTGELDVARGAEATEKNRLVSAIMQHDHSIHSTDMPRLVNLSLEELREHAQYLGLTPFQIHRGQQPPQERVDPRLRR